MTSRRGFLSVAVLGAAACANPLSAFAQHRGIEPGPIALRGSTTVPFVLAGNNIYFKAVIERTPYAFIFDTCGTGTVTPELQRRRKFASIGQATLRGVGAEAEPVDIVRVPSFTLGSAVYSAGPFIVLSRFVPSNPFPDVPFGGIVGREIFGRLVTVIDYEHRLLSFHDAGSFTPDAAADSLPLTMRGGALPNVSGSIDGHSGRFDIDSGASQALTLTAKLADDSGALGGFGRAIEVVVGRGAGGALLGTASRGARLALGGAALERPVVTIARSRGGVFDDPGFDGNVGGDVLRRFTVTLDVPRATLYLRPNRAFGEPFAFNRAGVFCRAQGDGQLVDAVVSAGPAAAAGIAVGDTIVEIDGRPASSLTPAVLKGIWEREPRTQLRLALVRSGRRRNVIVTLRDLV